MGVDASDYIEEVTEIDSILEGELELYDEAEPLDESDTETEPVDTANAADVADTEVPVTETRSGEEEYPEFLYPEESPIPEEPDIPTLQFYRLTDDKPNVPSFRN